MQKGSPMLTPFNVQRRAAMLFPLVAGLALLLMSGCATTMVSGDAGCMSYGEARLSLPRPLGDGALAAWVADLDDRMTGSCK